MAAYDRRSFAGGAVATTITAGINGSDLTIAIAASTGWPTGSGGEYGVILDRGTASEEKILVSSRSSLTLTVPSGGRGIDGTSGVSHATGATAELVILARDLDEANAHLADDTLDHHSQYMKADGTRHDLEARHTFGAALGTPAAPADVGTTPAAGTGDNPAREDHVHQIGAGAIDSASMFAAGVVDAAAIGADAVGSSELANGAVDTAAIADDQVTAAKTNAEAWTAHSPSYSGITVGNGTVVCRYMKRGKDVDFRFSFVLGSTSSMSAGGLGTISLPHNAHASGIQTLTGVAYDSSATTVHPCNGFINPINATDQLVVGVDTAIPFTWASGDALVITGTYEAA